MTDRPIQSGDRVRNPKVREWGLGRVLSVAGDSARVLFKGAGEKQISLKHVTLELILGDEAKDPYLDLPTVPGRKRLAVRDFDSLVAEFLRRFPSGFRDSHYIEQERDYKVEASTLCQGLLGQAELARLIEGRHEDEVVIRALRVLNATNLVFPNEKMSLRDGLRDRESGLAFARSLGDLLYGGGEPNVRFDSFAELLHQIGAAKWTIATYYPFLRFPEQFMFLKPLVTCAAADRCGFDISYRADLNWPTYRKLTEFAAHLRSRLAILQPADLIDVQSFIWVCGGGYE